MAGSAMVSSGSKTQSWIDSFNDSYLTKHKSFEDNFWATKMNLANNSSEALANTKNELDEFLNAPATLEEARALMADPATSDEQKKILKCVERTLMCYIIEDEGAMNIKKQITTLEASLAAARNVMKLGYTAADGTFTPGSSVVLRNLMRTSDEEPVRKAAYEGLRSIGPFVLDNGFFDIIKQRNALAKQLGFVDYYDMKVTQAEGFDKKTLFGMLEDLEKQTKPIALDARKRLANEKGESALEPWNMGYAMAGDLTKKQDEYFPFATAVKTWGQSFSRMGIRYEKSQMNLDLLDRDGKYSNGFCHWTVPAFTKGDGTWVPAVTNFTSLALPSQPGSGQTALATLMHEGGHAAHFANVNQGSPLFSQERAPTSVAYAETQSMTLDSLCDDAAWLARYAKNQSGERMPWSLIQEAIEQKRPYASFMVRAMLAVPFFEKALYELPEDQLTAEKVLELADEVENDIQGGLSARPLLSVPHILSDEASAYYHGYVLAEMAVHQNREYFMKKFPDQGIVDNPEVGPMLTKGYWNPGNAEMFLDLVERFTGEPLSCKAWVKELSTPIDEVIASEKKDYDAAVAAPERDDPVELNMQMRLVHGDETIADSNDGGFDAACEKFKSWVNAKYSSKM